MNPAILCSNKIPFPSFVFALVVLFFFNPSSAESKSLTLGIHPFQSIATLEQKFSPLVKHLTEVLNQPVQLRIGSSYQEHIDAIGHDQIDIAYIGPVGYVQMVDTYGKKPLIAGLEVNGENVFAGVIAARDSSALVSLSDITQGNFAFVDAHSTMGFLLPAYMLLNENPSLINEERYDFLETHENVALGVLSGDYCAGSIKESVFYAYEKRGLKLLAKTPEVTEHLFVASTGLNPQVLISLREAFVKLNRSSEGADAMHAIKPTISAFIPIEDQAYDVLRATMKTLQEKGLMK